MNFLLLNVALLQSVVVADGENLQPYTFESAGELIQGETGLGSNLSDDKKAITWLFDSVQASTDDTGIQTKVITLRAPLHSGSRPVVVTQDFRGTASAEDGADVSMTVFVAGSTFIIPINEHQEEGDDIDTRLTVSVPPGQDYIVTVVISAQRSSKDAEIGATIQLDSIDLEIQGEVVSNCGCQCR